jgi:hypothetical protein
MSLAVRGPVLVELLRSLWFGTGVAVARVIPRYF